MSDNHGKTPAAWTAVTIMFVGFCIAGVAFVVPQHWLFWVGLGIVVLGGVVGKVMSMMGMGSDQDQPTGDHPTEKGGSTA
jgi:peptidoglycan/LPS O-acetylase OafA/YrhL